ncbi:MAG: inorganic pyrophosphatase [Vicinamibacterales bacterium]
MSDHAHANPVWGLMGMLFRSHPWHGVPIGRQSPEIVTCFIEIVPSDLVKYEIDKSTGHLKIDRPQQYSNVCPAPYGLIPQTFCGSRVAALSAARTGRAPLTGDGDPLDVCVLTQSPITHGDILLRARPIGGLRMIDGEEADDKVLAVLEGDAAYGTWRDVEDCPSAMIERLVHYFETYKLAPGATEKPCEVAHVFGRDAAHELIDQSRLDYQEHFGALDSLLSAVLRGQ